MNASWNVECPECGAGVGEACVVGGVKGSHGGRVAVVREVAAWKRADREVRWARVSGRGLGWVTAREAEREAVPRGRRPKGGKHKLLAAERTVMRRRLSELGLSTLGVFHGSPGWKVTEKWWRGLYGWRGCYVCGSRSSSLHHVTYARLGMETGGDLVPLCRVHHGLTHRLHVEFAVPLQVAHMELRRLYPPGSFKTEGLRDAEWPLAAGDAERVLSQVERRGPVPPVARTFEDLAESALGPATVNQLGLFERLYGWRPERLSKAQAGELLSLANCVGL